MWRYIGAIWVSGNEGKNTVVQCSLPSEAQRCEITQWLSSDYLSVAAFDVCTVVGHKLSLSLYTAVGTVYQRKCMRIVGLVWNIISF